MIGCMKKTKAPQKITFWQRIQTWLYPLQTIMMVGTLSFVVGVSGSMTFMLVRGGTYSPTTFPVANFSDTPISEHVNPVQPKTISPIFTPEIQHWSTKIMQWAELYDIDPNMLATVMQIESCGDWQAGSIAGAQGLFQVMPFHFTTGEDSKDPDTNARRGINYLKQSMATAGGHFGLALAGYNGGIGVINAGWARWAQETRNYYIWGSGIYMDAIQGKTESASLQDWLNAGGVNLCGQAAARIANPPTQLPVGQATGS